MFYFFFIPVRPIPQLEHLPFSFFRSLKNVSQSKMINEHIKNKFYADKLIFVSGVGNSASTVLGQCVAEISGRANINYGKYMRNNRDFNLRLELLRQFPNGGVYRHHFPALTPNLKVLELLESQYIINFRNPADIIAAKYCTFSTRVFDSVGRKAEYLEGGYFNVPKDIFGSGNDIHDSIDFLLKDGYLNATLMWMVDWLVSRDLEKSIIVKYEDIKLKHKNTMNYISNFLNGNDISDDIYAKCDSLMKINGEMHKELANKYPRGWTGKVGAWKDYFSDKNYATYHKQIKNFLEYYPQADKLVEIYPNILNLK